MSIKVTNVVRSALAMLAVFLVAIAAVPAATAQGLVEGKQYTRMKPGLPVETGKKIEVIEFFSYGCPHCAAFEPLLQDWMKTMPPDVAFVRVPVSFQPRWEILAKDYYTLDALGEGQKLSPEVFVAIHEKGIALWNDATFFDWTAAHGLDRKKVEDLYNSFTMASRMSRAKQLARAYNVESVPLVIIDGKFVTSPAQTGTHAATIAAMNELIAKARAERPKS
jgi:protein dithiol oxidoreductase (disulfide-forming)